MLQAKLESWWNIGAISSVYHVKDKSDTFLLVVKIFEYFDNEPKTSREIAQYAIESYMVTKFNKISSLSLLTLSIESTLKKYDECFKCVDAAKQAYCMDFTSFPLRHPSGVTDDDIALFQKIQKTLQYQKGKITIAGLSNAIGSSKEQATLRPRVLGLVDAYHAENPGLFDIDEKYKIVMNKHAHIVGYTGKSRKRAEMTREEYDALVDRQSPSVKRLWVKHIYPTAHYMPVNIGPYLETLDENAKAFLFDVIHYICTTQPAFEFDMNTLLFRYKYGSHEKLTRGSETIKRARTSMGDIEEMMMKRTGKIVKQVDDEKKGYAIQPEDVRVLSDVEVKNMLMPTSLELKRELTISTSEQTIRIEIPYVGPYAEPYFSFSPKYLYKTDAKTFEFKDPNDNDDDSFVEYFGDIVEIPNFLINVTIFQDFCKRMIQVLEEKSKGELARPFFDSTRGVINWDIPFVPKKWLVDILTECDKLEYLEPSLQNPSIEDDDTVAFLRSGLSHIHQDEILFYLNRLKSAKCIMHDFYVRSIYDEHLFDSFLKSDKRIAIMSFTFRIDNKDPHERFVFKDSNRCIIMDPWMQCIHFPWIDVCESNGYAYEFKARKKDQGAEGSCAIVAMSRAFMMALEGFESVDAPLDHSVLILVHMLMSEFRDKKSRVVTAFTNNSTFNMSQRLAALYT